MGDAGQQCHREFVAGDQAMNGPARAMVLTAAFLGMVFDGLELGLMPVASLSLSRDLMGDAYTPEWGGIWFVRFTAAMMLGAAIGGIALGDLGDRLGRSKAMGISILSYSLFAALGSWASTQEQMLLLRFLVGLGVGGMWPNGIALVSECWPAASKPLVSGIMAAGLNAGIFLLSQMARQWPITPEAWRWVFQLAGVPAILGALVVLLLPESPRWLEHRGTAKDRGAPLPSLFKPQMIRLTLVGIILSCIPMVGAWAASKWMIPWADEIAKAYNPGYKAVTQGWWSVGAIIGSLAGAQLAHLLGSRLSYFLISLAALGSTLAMFRLTAPLETAFLPVVFIQGWASTLFFGWLAVYLPELFPIGVRAAGSGLAYNSGRFATAFGVLASGWMFSSLGGDYSRAGAAMAWIYGLGLFAIWLAPANPSVTKR